MTIVGTLTSKSLTVLMTALALLVLLWRLGVAVQAITEPGTAVDSALPLALGLMGVVYLACGLLAWSKVRTPTAALFGVYCLCQGLHWGGAPDFGGPLLQMAIWLFYFTVTMLGISALLHFTLRFPRPWERASGLTVRTLLYAPVGLGAVLAAARLVLWSSPKIGGTVQSFFFLLETLQVNL